MASHSGPSIGTVGVLGPRGSGSRVMTCCIDGGFSEIPEVANWRGWPPIFVGSELGNGPRREFLHRIFVCLEEGSMRNVLVYLAGKCDGPKWEVAKSVPKIKGISFIASDGGDHGEHGFGVAQFDFDQCGRGGILREIVSTCVISKLTECDMVFAYLETPDSFGSIAEVAFAAALGKPCFVVVCEPIREEWPSQLFDAYWLVSCLPRVQVLAVSSRQEGSSLLEEAVRMIARRERSVVGAVNSTGQW